MQAGCKIQIMRTINCIVAEGFKGKKNPQIQNGNDQNANTIHKESILTTGDLNWVQLQL